MKTTSSSANWGVFGALDMPIPLLNLASPAVLVFAAALSAHERSSLRPVPAIGLGALSLVYMAGAMTALYITWTPVGMVRIIGLQARYFLPSFLMLFVLAAALLSHVVEPRLKGDEARPARLAPGAVHRVCGGGGCAAGPALLHRAGVSAAGVIPMFARNNR